MKKSTLLPVTQGSGSLPNRDSSPSVQQEPLANVSVCVPVLERTDKLRLLLESLDRLHPAEVVVADNGQTEDRVDLYGEPWSFDLEVLDLPFDCGIGRCRYRAAQAAESDYLLVVDCDMRVPESVAILRKVLQERPELGAVAGALVEQGYLRAGATNFHTDELVGGRQALVQSIREPPQFEPVAGTHIARVDKLPNAMLVRSACVDDYQWDQSLTDKEHLDWFVGHWQRTDWQFATCPDVLFQHFPTTSGQYWEEFRHGNEERQAAAKHHFLNKWGYDDIIWRDARLYGTQPRPPAERLYKAATSALPTSLSYPLKRAIKRVIE